MGNKENTQTRSDAIVCVCACVRACVCVCVFVRECVHVCGPVGACVCLLNIPPTAKVNTVLWRSHSLKPNQVDWRSRISNLQGHT